MFLSKSYTVIIPLRSGSKGLPNKNVMKLAGKPLYLHAADLALEANASRIIVTTNIEQVLRSKAKEGIEYIRRPENLCGDTVAMSPVLLHAVRRCHVQGTVVLLQPTSPLRSLQDIESALDLFERSRSDLVLTVTAADSAFLKWGEVTTGGIFNPVSSVEMMFSNRQNLPTIYKPNGAVYVFDAEWLLENEGLESAKKISAVKMPQARSLDIDTLDDFIRCQDVLTNSRD